MMDPGKIACSRCVLSLKAERPRARVRRRKSVEDILEEEGIRDFDEDITKMSRAELKGHFGARTTGRINLSLLIKNMIWQTLGKLRAGEMEPFTGNIRSFWYSHVKPVVSRAGALTASRHPDNVMTQMFVRLVMDLDLMRYREFGFSDENADFRRIGGKNGHVVLVAEKQGHFPLLKELHADYDVTVISLGGQPSLLSTEYFAGEMETARFELGQAYPLLTIVDYDPAGDIIAGSFIAQLEDLEFGEALRTDLVLPGHMSREQVRLNKYRLSRRKREKKKNEQWVAKTGGVDGKAYGLEADAMPPEQLTAVFDREVERYLKLGVKEVKRRRLKQELIEVLEKKILQKLATG